MEKCPNCESISWELVERGIPYFSRDLVKCRDCGKKWRLANEVKAEGEKCPKCESENVREEVLLRGIDYHFKCKDCKERWTRQRLMSREELARIKSQMHPPGYFMKGMHF